MTSRTRSMRRLALLVAAGALGATIAPATSARQDAPPAEAPADARRLMDAARERLTLGDTTGAIARALLARQLDGTIEIPAIIVARGALADAPAPPGGRDPALADLRAAVADLDRQAREQSRALERVERDLDDDARADPVIPRLEREIDDLGRRAEQNQRDLARLQREVDRLRR